MAFGLACIHGMFGEDLGVDPNLLANALDGLALPDSLLEVVVCLQSQPGS